MSDSDKITKGLNPRITSTSVEGVLSGDEYFQDDYFQDDYFQADLIYASANVEKSTLTLEKDRITVMLNG